jgi:pyruvate,orthophosphate dikinase
MKTLDIAEMDQPTVLKNKPARFVFSFKEGDGKNKQLLGGKGANLCEMTQIGLNVPPGFVISTEACLRYLATANRTCPKA